MQSRIVAVMAGALVALAAAIPSYAQGKGGSKGKGPTRPPSSGAVSTQSSSSSTSVSPGAVAAAMPFAWMDDASVMEPGNVWVGISMARWQGSGQSQTIFPVVDAAVGLTPRTQFGVSAPRAAGGLGTTFLTTKIAVLSDDVREMKVAVGPTVEILNDVAPGQRRVEWGLPVSAQLDRWNSRLYGSTGYFSPGIWYAGAGFGRPVSDRVGVSISYSHAWATSPEPAAGGASAPGPQRDELSGGASYDLTGNIAVFGSVTRTLGMAAEEGAGTTIGFGLSWSVAPAAFTR